MFKVVKIIVVSFIFLISGCASTSIPTTVDNNDPFESLNRASYSFNSVIDKAIMKPVAKGYDAVTPDPVKTGISNFFANLDEIPTMTNGVLQGKFAHAFNDLGRFLINSTLGLAGFIDVATDLGLEQHDEEFGQTLGTWGIESGPYIVLPFLGPSTVRDALARPVDSYTSLKKEVDHIPTRNSIYALELLDLRYRLLAIDSQLEDALDEYTFVRDAFLMRRQYQVYDGNPPEQEDLYDDECYEDDECDNEEIID